MKLNYIFRYVFLIIINFYAQFIKIQYTLNSAFFNAQLITRYWPMTGHCFLLARKDLLVLQNRQNGKQWSIGPVGLFKKAQINCGDLLKAFI